MAPKQINVADIVRHDGPIALPKSLTTAKAIEILQRKLAYDAEPVSIRETIDAYPWDGALALRKALVEMFGMAVQEQKQHFSFFGEASSAPPEQRSIAVGPDETTLVPWGKFSLPGINGHVSTVIRARNGRAVFGIDALCIHADEHKVRALILRCREIALAESIYRGKAIEMQFRNEAGETIPLPEPTFLRLSPMPAIFSAGLERAIDTNILTPLRYRATLKANGIPFKRGVLLAGEYGTGKTLLAQTVARTATANGVTFIYVKSAHEMAEALAFAQGFMPAVVLVEDIDRVAGIERTDDVNDVLNTLDGIGTKSDDIMVILTTNHAESINPAMRRPGRIDVVLHVETPDAEAAERLVRHYGGSRIPEREHLGPVGLALAGQRPATIRETVERAKLESIRRSKGETIRLLASDLLASADVTIAEQGLFKPKPTLEHEPLAIVGTAIGNRILQHMNGN